MSSERVQVKLGAALAMLGAVLALIVNPLHGDLPGDPEAAFARVAATASWGLLHLGIMASVVFLLGGLLGLSQVADGPLARALARLSVVVALPGAAVMLVGLAIDGFATKALADLWASAAGADKAAAFRMALAVEEVQTALFHTWAALFTGVPFLLMGLSGLAAGGRLSALAGRDRRDRRDRRAVHGRVWLPARAGPWPAVQPVRVHRDAVDAGRRRTRVAPVRSPGCRLG